MYNHCDMTYSAKLLKNYYEKENNKIVFRNGMNLNQLAMEMWDRMGYKGVDISALSRIMRGERNFTFL